ncbi:protein-L-isoaspartate(D-aspartate) O-methyltransferase [Reichenbachiella versicolor]|uniref:protein-L-isoaspartate(D-aspartate) O-methyltransferase n=1 Tax=Reichenbachiella versicolor TaxID=1821036 RepID=UPI000D6E15E9|nr:protein-L-isoaspartate(D-aspartate) O-methyltransferase [Reichenbachiella versicolor]
MNYDVSHIKDTYKQKGMRRSLVRKLVEKGISNKKVLDAIGKVPRHVFFDEIFLEHAYQDKAFPIAEGQTISQPYTVAFQTELLNISEGHNVLEIGTGSGYQCCILLEVGANVVTIEYKERLSLIAQKQLGILGYNPTYIIGDGSLGNDQYAPYDAIIVTAGAPTVPQALISQLKVGGKLVIPVGDDKVQKMLRITRVTDSKLSQEEFHNFSFVPLLGKQGWRK